MTRWTYLPAELRIMILEQLAQHRHVASYAVVCKEWQTVIEKMNFSRLRVKQSCLDKLERLIRPRRLVKHIWLNIELNRYDCRLCRQMEPAWSSQLNNIIIVDAISKLFAILSAWEYEERGELTLELNMYSTSDWEHWFYNGYFGASDREIRTNDIHDPKHGWRKGEVVFAPSDDAIRRPYEKVLLEPREELPEVKAVTKFQLRRHCRRQWPPPALWYIWGKLPRLEHIMYEPWQIYHKDDQYVLWDNDYPRMFNTHLPEKLKILTVFEDFNEDHLALFQLRRDANHYENPGPVRIATPAVGAAFAVSSLELEQVSASFIADAQDFFAACQPEWRWNRLHTLQLTSRLMKSTSGHLRTTRLLRDAGKAALLMPQLRTITLWNGGKGEACAFVYCREDATITWRGTWECKNMKPLVFQAWKRVADEYARSELRVVIELLDCKIRSHADAIQCLGLKAVVDPVSRWQIEKENSHDSTPE